MTDVNPLSTNQGPAGGRCVSVKVSAYYKCISLTHTARPLGKHGDEEAHRTKYITKAHRSKLNKLKCVCLLFFRKYMQKCLLRSKELKVKL